MQRFLTVSLLALVLCTPGFAQDQPQQPTTAVDQISVWLVGFHPMKDEPGRQFIAHHLCQQLRPDLMQCVLYDGNQADARMTGIEYIVPQEVFESFDETEQQFWHPHNFEIFSGMLITPEVPDDMALLAGAINSYGKTFHIWDAGIYDPDTETFTAEEFPTGEAMLAWSFNHPGQALPGLIETGLSQFGDNVDENRAARQEYVEQAEPQCGVNAIADQFENAGEATPGVEAKEGC
jgi:hypothetical protein